MRSLAFVGCAHIHTPGFIRACQERSVPVTAVWDHEAGRAAKNAEALGCPAKELREILDDPSIEGLVICSETNRHESLVMEVVDSGKALFIEKPLGMGARDALMMANAIEAAGCLFQTGYRMRGEPAVQTIRRLIQEGSLGAITRARASTCHNGALGGWFDGEWRWMADRSQAGVGAFGDLGTHGLDVLLWLFGEVDRVSAVIEPGTARYVGCDEFGEALIRFKSGVAATLAASWDDVADPVRLLVSGTEGHATLTNDGLFVKCDALGLDGKSAAPLDEGASAGFGAFLDWALGFDADFVHVRQAAYRCVVMDAIYRASESKSVQLI